MKLFDGGGENAQWPTKTKKCVVLCLCVCACVRACVCVYLGEQPERWGWEGSQRFFQTT